MVPVFVGDRVITMDGYNGSVRFKGNVSFKRFKCKMIGIELDEWIPNGNHGIINGHKYFECEPGFGYFVKYKGIKAKAKRNNNVDLNTLLSPAADKIKRFQHNVHHDEALTSATVTSVYTSQAFFQFDKDNNNTIRNMLGPLHTKLNRWQATQQRQTVFNDTKAIRIM
eukprot:UN03224